MNALLPAFCLGNVVVFAVVAKEAAKSYGLCVSLRRVTIVAPALLAIVSSSKVSAAGAEGYAEATVLAYAAIGAGTDLQTGYVLDRVALTALGILFGLSIVGKPLGLSLAAAALTGAPLLAIYLVTRGRGIGLGDVKMAATIGLGLGLPDGFAALSCAVLAAGGFGIAVLICGRSRRERYLRFAPFLALGACYAVLKCD